jgi:Macrocin-O-methyltransferase (TylF)
VWLAEKLGVKPVGVIAKRTVDPTNRLTVDRTNLHRVWKAVLIGFVLVVVAACYAVPALGLAIGLLLLLLVCARLIYQARDRYIPNLYARDIAVYDDAYRAFITRTLSELRECRIAGHTLLWEASQLAPPSPRNAEELQLDLGVWIGWSTRLTSDTCGRMVHGFDTFSGLVEDWQVDDQMVVKRGTFSLAEPLAQRLMSDTGVTQDDDGLPAALGRQVQFIKGMTYDTLAPFLAERPGAPIRLFHMDLDTYESCLHALESCRDRFVEGSILVFDEYLVTNAEMQAFYEFQSKYNMQWRYRSWGLEIWEMNIEMVTSRWRRLVYYFLAIALYWLGNGNFAWAFWTKRFWRFWLGAPIGDILFMLGAAGQRKSVSLEITGLGELGPANP